MKTRTSTTAILLFARSTASEVQEKWLPKGEEIYSQLNMRAKKLAQDSGLAFFHSTEADQIGADFGSRFSNSIQQIFDQGYTSVISIGNDTPNLTQEDIRNALDKIQDQNAVIGPSKDGGIYLLGIHAADFDKQEFSRLRWCTRYVQESLIEYFSYRDKKPALLKVYYDLDTIADVQSLSNVKTFIPIGIINLLKSILHQSIQWFESADLFCPQPLWQPNLNKGSPA